MLGAFSVSRDIDACWHFAMLDCMTPRVQSPALEMTMLVSPGPEGKVAKGCHSKRGEEEIDRHEKRWMGLENVRRRACGERIWAVKVQRRTRSQGYSSTSVMAVRFQNVGFWMNRELEEEAVDEMLCVRMS